MARLSSRRITAEDLLRVRLAVEEAESKTSGEIVPLVVAASGDYSWVGPVLALFGVILGLGAVEYDRWMHSFPLTVQEAMTVVAAGAAFGFALSLFPGIRRRVVGEERIEAAVRQRANAEFIENGLCETKGRTGVLIYISLFEHRVRVMGDRGIHAKVKDGYWAEICAELAAFIRRKRLVDGIVQAIGRVGNELATHFPRGANDVNELPDRLRTED